MTMQAQAPTQRVQSPPAFLNAPGEMAELIRTVDWSQTPLGPAESWPQSLRTSLSICLHSHFPILLWWGPELVMLYNDAYRPMLGASKHPAAMGQPGQQCWAEIWHIIGPMLAGVLQEGKATWSENQMLPLDRNGYVEECYFTFSYSPISDESGGIGGVFCAVTETSQQVIATRRLVILNALATHSGSASTPAQALNLAAETLALHPADLPFGLIYRFDTGSHNAVLEAAINLPIGTMLSPERIDLSLSGQVWPLAALVKNPNNPFMLLENLGDEYALLPGRVCPGQPRQVLILPIQQEQEHIYGFFVAGISPRLLFDETYHSFLRLVADQFSSAINRAAAYEYERKKAIALAEIDRAKTDFFANVSHEFRTPLTLMLAPLEQALSSPQPSLNGEELSLLHRNALRLLKLVNALLDFSSIEAGRSKANYRPVDLAALTIDLTSMFRSAIEKAGLSLHIHCPALTEPVYVDADMWEKILFNLISNAFKFTFEGEISISLLQTAREIELAVRDTGIGIAEEELPHIFTRFHRIRQARSRSHEGSGIGNALVKELVECHGGSIEVESQLGRGSTFRVHIPLGKQHLPQDQIEEIEPLTTTPVNADAYVLEALCWLPDNTYADQTERGWTSPAHSSSVRCPDKAKNAEKTILLVDDNADMRRYLLKLLRPCWQVQAFSDGATALKAAMDNPPDLVLTDIMMPVMDGLQLLENLRRCEKTRRIPIIIISARAGVEAHIEGVKTGADDYIVKPFSPGELLAKIDTNLELARVRQEADRKIIENEKRLRAYIQTSFEAVYQMSPDWQEMKMLVGNKFIVDTAYPSRAWIDTYIHPDSQANVLDTIQKAIPQKQLFELEYQTIRSDGSLGWVHSRAVPILDENNQIIEWIGTARDITERKNTEQELRQLNTQLDALVRTRTAAAEEKAEQLRSLAAQLVEVEENERRKFAELLHDDLQQIIGAAQMLVQGLIKTCFREHSSIKVACSCN